MGEGDSTRVRPTQHQRAGIREPGNLRGSFAGSKKVVAQLEAAYAQKREKDAQAKAQLAQIDEILLRELGITPPAKVLDTVENRCFFRGFSQVMGERFDPNFFRSEFQILRQKIESQPHCRLGEIIGLSCEVWDQESVFSDVFPYIEIGAIDLALGEVGEVARVPVAEAASRARMWVRPDDLLISLTRPTRRAITFAPNDLAEAIASTGFAIVRDFDEQRIFPRFLYHVLRSGLCTPQFEMRSSGGNYPAITTEQLLEILVPLPTKDKQVQISELLDHTFDQAKALFAQAQAELNSAKGAIVAMILGDE